MTHDDSSVLKFLVALTVSLRLIPCSVNTLIRQP